VRIVRVWDERSVEGWIVECSRHGSVGLYGDRSEAREACRRHEEEDLQP
jgi:hypothetical protein